MSAFDDMVLGSYGGVPFLFTGHQLSGGRKKIVKQYPNSDFQSAEDVGKIPRVFSMRFSTQEDQDGNNYTAIRDRMLSALEAKAPSVLLHPLYGRLDNYVALAYTCDENLSHIGEARFNVTFTRDDLVGAPESAGDTISNVLADSEDVSSYLNEHTVDSYVVTTLYPSNFTAAANKLEEIAEAFRDNATFIFVDTDAIDDFANELGSFANDITQLARDPQAIADSVQGLFASVNGLYTSAEGTFEVLQKFFDFGEADYRTPIETTTAGLTEREQNQRALNYLVRAQSLILNYTNASAIDYSTVTDVDNVSDILEAQYQDVINNGELDTQTIMALKDLRESTVAFFDNEKLTVYEIITINTKRKPARVLAFEYYGNDDLGADVVALNQDYNVAFYEDDVEIFTE